MKLDELLEKKGQSLEDPEIHKENYAAKKPPLLTRYAAALLDLIVAAIIVIGLFFACRYTILDPMGHKEDVEFVHNASAESGLFVEFAGGYHNVDDEGRYDTSKTAEQNYETRILYYYTNFSYPKQFSMLEAYFNDKEASKLWVKLIPNESYDFQEGTSKEEIEAWMSSHYERADNAGENSVVGFLSKQYETAVNKFSSTPEYVQHTRHAKITEYFIILISEVIGLGIYYVLIPLLNKKGQTPFKMVFKIVVADPKEMEISPRIRILLRYVILVAYNIIIPTVWYFFMPAVVGYLALIFPMTELIFLGFSGNNCGIHDFVAKTYLADFKQRCLVSKNAENAKPADKKNKRK